MWHLHPYTLIILTVFMGTFHCISLLLAAFRVSYRRRIRRLWWDDYFVVFAALWELGKCLLHIQFLASAKSPNRIRYWIGTVCHMFAIWASRISLALAMARVFPPHDTTHKLGVFMAALFSCFGVTIIIWAFVVCHLQESSSHRWITNGMISLCDTTQPWKILVLISSTISDGLLISIPLFKLWKVKLPRRERQLVLGGFAASSFSTLATIASIVFQLASTDWEPARGFLRVLTLHLEVAITVVVSNALVVVAYLYSHSRREPEPHRAPSPPDTRNTSNAQQTIANADTNTLQPFASSLVLTDILEGYTSQFDLTASFKSGTNTSIFNRTS